MLNVFPTQYLAPLAYVLLRLTLGLIFLHFAKKALRADETGSRYVFASFISATVGIMLILGIYTQLAAIGAFFFTIASRFSLFKDRGVGLPEKTIAILIGAVSLSLFITGGGPFGFDLPI